MAEEPASRDATLLPERYRDRAVLRPNEVFELLGVKPTAGWKLINEGPLERLKLGRKSIGVTVASIERLLASGASPAPPQPEPVPAQPTTAAAQPAGPAADQRTAEQRWADDVAAVKGWTPPEPGSHRVKRPKS